MSRKGGSYIDLLCCHLYGLFPSFGHSLQNIPILISCYSFFLNQILYFSLVRLVHHELILDYVVLYFISSIKIDAKMEMCLDTSILATSFIERREYEPRKRVSAELLC
jgi:hypothetical protein